MGRKLYIGVVPFSDKYTHVVDFKNRVSRREYFLNDWDDIIASERRLHFTQYEPTNEPRYLTGNERVITVKGSYTSFFGFINYNYIYFIYENNKEIFGFIKSIERNTQDTTNITFTIDMWQTYLFGTKPTNVLPPRQATERKIGNHILEAFVKREHEDRWNLRDGGGLEPIKSQTIENLETGKFTVQEARVLRPLTSNNVSYDGFLLINDVGEYSVQMNGLGVGTHPNYNFKTEAFFSYLFLLFHTNKRVKIKTQSDTTYYEIASSAVNGAFSYGFRLREDLLHTQYKHLALDSEHSIKFSKLRNLPYTLTLDSQDSTHLYYTINTNMIRFVKYTATDDLYCMILTRVETDKNKEIMTLYENFIEDEDYHAFTPEAYDVHIYEPKLYNSEFEKNLITTYTGDPLEIRYELTIGETTPISFISTLNVWLQDEVYIKNNYTDMFYTRQRFKNNNDLALANERELNYVMNNKNQITTSQTLSSAQLGLGVATAGVGLGILSGGAMSGLGIGLALGGASQIVNGGGNLAKEVAKLNDLKNEADTIKSQQNNLFLDEFNNLSYFHYIRQGLLHENKSRVFKYFQRYGYLVDRFKVPNINTRYYFNYVQTSMIEIDPTFINESEVREILESIFMRGTTIWHWRSVEEPQRRVLVERFLDYDYANVENNVSNDRWVL